MALLRGENNSASSHHALEAASGRSHDIGNNRKPGMVPQLLDRYWQGLSPIGMLVDRTRQIYLLRYAEQVFHGNDEKAGGSISEVFCHRGKVIPRNTMPPSCLLQ